MKRVFITGTAGFIGYHIAELLLGEGFEIHGYDGLTAHYDVSLKRRRHQRLLQHPNFTATEAMLEDVESLRLAAISFTPEVVMHLAAQAGVRYSLEAPRAYVDSNIIGTFNLLEVVKDLQVEHFLLASTSSIYGANEEMPFREKDRADSQLSIYAATKKATESIAHSYAHLFQVPTTVMRFFTVYGPWGRPDLALFRFVDSILDGRPIDIYNNGKMQRDFTFVGDLVRAIRLLLPIVPVRPRSTDLIDAGDSISHVAPYRVVNIGNSQPVELLDFVDAIEACIGRKAIRNNLPLQAGDVPTTWADTALLYHLTGYQPGTTLIDGVEMFVNWFRDYYGK